MRTAAIAYPPPWRIAAAALRAVSFASLLVIAVLLILPDDGTGIGTRLQNPLRLMRVFTYWSLAPRFGAWIIQRLFAAELSVEDGTLVLHRRAQRIEMPCSAIDAVVPWAIPLPSGGVRLRLSSGRWFGYSLQVRDPVAFAAAVGRANAGVDPAAVYAQSIPYRRWWHGVLAYVVFALVPMLPVHRANQWIAFGGTFGEYYMYGLRAYLLGFAVYWGTAIVYLVLWAALLRAVLEPVVLATSRLAPARTLVVRRAVERVDRVFYYGLVPLFLARLFFES
jgi:apolipoprotein N-acyltransferase